MSPSSTTFPILRWFALAWMIVWLPTYFRVWGWANLLHLCDVGVILSFVGIWSANSLLLSSQAVGAVAAGLLWMLDVSWRLATVFAVESYPYSPHSLCGLLCVGAAK